jgi:hypothetical protein
MAWGAPSAGGDRLVPSIAIAKKREDYLFLNHNLRKPSSWPPARVDERGDARTRRRPDATGYDSIRGQKP